MSQVKKLSLFPEFLNVMLILVLHYLREQFDEIHGLMIENNDLYLLTSYLITYFITYNTYGLIGAFLTHLLASAYNNKVIII